MSNATVYFIASRITLEISISKAEYVLTKEITKKTECILKVTAVFVTTETFSS